MVANVKGFALKRCASLMIRSASSEDSEMALQVSSSFKNEEIDISSYGFWDDSKVLFGEILVTSDT